MRNPALAGTLMEPDEAIEQRESVQRARVARRAASRYAAGMMRSAVPIVLSVGAQAAEWPQFREAERNGESNETGLLQQPPAGGPRLVGNAPGQQGDREFVAAFDAAPGNVAWRDRSVGTGNCIYAGKRHYCMGEDGAVGLIEPNPKAYTEISRFKSPAGPRRTWTPPVLASGRLYLREQDNLYNYDVQH